MKIIHHLTIDMARRLPDAPLAAVQNDSNTRYVEITLLENGKNWEVPDGITAAVAFRKPDGHNGLYDQLPNGDAAVVINGSAVSAILAPQVLTCAGEVKAAVVFHDAALNQLATFPFTIRVAANPAAGQSVSNDYYRYSTMEEVSEAVEAALAALETEKQEFLDKAEKALADVRNALETSAPAIVCEASGEVISASDASDRPLKGLSIYGKTVQNGTPTPENPVPLESVGAGGSIGVMVTGKNLITYPYAMDTRTLNGVTWTVDADGSITASGTATGWSGINLVERGIIPNVLFRIRINATDNSNVALIFKLYDANNVEIASERVYSWKDINPADYSTASHYAMQLVRDNDTVTSGTFKPSINIGTTATPYEQPKPMQTLTASTPNGLPGIPVSSGGNYTDENGQQWICDEIDFSRGVRVQRVNTEVFDGTEKWSNVGKEITYEPKLEAKDNGREVFCLCSHYPAVTRYQNYDHQNEDGWLSISANGWRIRVVDNVNCNGDPNALKTLLAEKYASGNPVTIHYALATPIETPLSAEELAQYSALHSNKPTTTVFNDATAGMKMDYVADTKTYIDQKLAAISAAVLNA